MTGMGRGPAAKIDAPRDLPTGCKWVQWKVENYHDVARFLEDFVVHVRKAPPNKLLITMQGGRNIKTLEVNPGDTLVMRPETAMSGPALGLVPAPDRDRFRESEDPADFRL